MKKIFFTVFVFVLFNVSMAALEARVLELNGKVEIKNAGSQTWQPIAVGGLIEKNSIISTGIKSTAVISVGASRISISPLSMLTLEELVLKENTLESTLYLRTGRVRADVTPPSGQKLEFTVRSPTTTASVRGTSFSFDGNKLSVYSGKVAFFNNSGQKVFVNPNQRSYSNPENQRLALPFEAELSIIRPTMSDFNKTGAGRNDSNKQGITSVEFVPQWE